jgi:hypothetical protein
MLTTFVGIPQRLAGRGLGRGADAPERKEDGFEDTEGLAEDEVSREAEHGDATAEEETRPAPVVVLRHRVEVLPTVELDGQTPGGAVEVQDVRAAGMLPPKFEAREPFSPQLSPEGSLCVGAVAAQSTATSERDIHTAVFGTISSRLLASGIDRRARS